MKNLFYTLITLTAFAVIGCGEPSISEQFAKQEAEFSEVMKGHDEVMPKTGELSKLSREMKNYVVNTPDMNDSLKARVNQTIVKMLDAEEAMFAWMADIKQLPELRKDKNHSQILDYLEDQEEIMEKVKKMTDESLSQGKEVWAGLATPVDTE